MDLHLALKKAISVVTQIPKGDRERLGLVVQKILLCGTSNLYAAEAGVNLDNCKTYPYVTARTDRMGIICHVDQSIPSVLLDPAQCKAASEHPLTATTVSSGERILTMQSGGKRTFRVPFDDAGDYPSLPDLPKKWVEVNSDDWQAVLGIVHAAGTTSDPAMVRVIRFEDEQVVATDGERVSVAYGLFPEFQGQVASEFFKRWPKGQVEVGNSGRYLWARVGSEWRWAVKQDTRAPDLSEYWKDIPWRTSGFIVDTAVLQKAVKAGVKVSDTQTLNLEIVDDDLLITAHVEKGVTRGYKAAVPIVRIMGAVKCKPIMVSGKALKEAVREFKAPRTGLCLNGDKPVALWNGRQFEILWTRLS